MGLRQEIGVVTFKCGFEARGCGKGLGWSRLSALLKDTGLRQRIGLVTFKCGFEARDCGKGLGWSLLSVVLKRGIAARDWAGHF